MCICVGFCPAVGYSRLIVTRNKNVVQDRKLKDNFPLDIASKRTYIPQTDQTGVFHISLPLPWVFAEIRKVNSEKMK